MIDNVDILRKVICNYILEGENLSDNLIHYYTYVLEGEETKKLFLDLIYDNSQISDEDKKIIFKSVNYEKLKLSIIKKYICNLSSEEQIKVLLYKSFNLKLHEVISYAKDINACSSDLIDIYFFYASVASDFDFKNVVNEIIKLNPSDSALISFTQRFSSDYRQSLLEVFGYEFVKRGLLSDLGKLFYDYDLNGNPLIALFDISLPNQFNSLYVSHFSEYDDGVISEFIDYLLKLSDYEFIDHYDLYKFINEDEIHKIISSLFLNASEHKHTMYLIKASKYADKDDFDKICSFVALSEVVCDMELLIKYNRKLNTDLFDSYLASAFYGSVFELLKKINANEEIINYVVNYYINSKNARALVKLAANFDVDLELVTPVVLSGDGIDLYTYTYVKNAPIDRLCLEVISRGVVRDIIRFVDNPNTNRFLLINGALNASKSADELIEASSMFDNNDYLLYIKGFMDKLVLFGDTDAIIRFARMYPDADKSILEDYILSLNDMDVIFKYTAKVNKYDYKKFMDKVFEIGSVLKILEYCFNNYVPNYDGVMELLLSKGNALEFKYAIVNFAAYGNTRNAAILLSALIKSKSDSINDTLVELNNTCGFVSTISLLDSITLKALLDLVSFDMRDIIVSKLKNSKRSNIVNSLNDSLEGISYPNKSLDNLVDELLLLGFAETLSFRKIDKVGIFKYMSYNLSKYGFALSIYLDFLTEDKEFDSEALDKQYLDLLKQKDNFECKKK